MWGCGIVGLWTISLILDKEKHFLLALAIAWNAITETKLRFRFFLTVRTAVGKEELKN